MEWMAEDGRVWFEMDDLVGFKGQNEGTRQVRIR